MIKLIATDMDGTLLNSKGEISEEFFKIFPKIIEKDIIFAAASGRQYYNLLKKFDKVKDKMMFIAENGTYVLYKGQELFVNSLDRTIAMELIDIGRKIDNAYVVYCGKNSAYIESDDERIVRETKKYYERYEIVEDLTKVEDEVLKITICDFSGSEFNSNNYYNDYKDKLQVTVSGEIWLDITKKGANKGIALDKIKKDLGISYEETMVFGDYLNDLEMMEEGYYSYAMENGHDDLKKASRFVAKANDENGVVEAIKDILKI